jgi:hypothetical protein
VKSPLPRRQPDRAKAPAGLGIALLSQSNAAEELKSSALSSIGVGDLRQATTSSR